MARVTAEQVKRIIPTKLDETQVQPFVDSANVFVDTRLLNKGLSEATLAEIEKWVACHMIALSHERTSVKEQAGGSGIEYAGVYGEGLRMTQYGQMAIQLDSSGTLEKEGRRPIKFYSINS